MGIFLVIVIILVACAPLIGRLLRGVIQRKAEDFIRQATGLPPRQKKRHNKNHRSYSGRKEREETSGSFYGRGSASGGEYSSGGHIIPPEYAEDVEYVEVKEYSSETVIADDGRRRRVYHESQVSDVEWEMVKKSEK